MDAVGRRGLRLVEHDYERRAEEGVTFPLTPGRDRLVRPPMR
jgi:hypothetical protein